MNPAPSTSSDSPRQTPRRETWFRRYRRARIAFAMLILIGITTPHATSAPPGEAPIDLAAPTLSAPGLDDPPVIMVIGAAMLVLAGALRLREGRNIRD